MNTPRRSALSVSSRNHRSTRFSHEDEVEVKCMWKRECLASCARTGFRRARARSTAYTPGFGRQHRPTLSALPVEHPIGLLPYSSDVIQFGRARLFGSDHAGPPAKRHRVRLRSHRVVNRLAHRVARGRDVYVGGRDGGRSPNDSSHLRRRGGIRSYCLRSILGLRTAASGYNKFTALARSKDPVATLYDATDGNLQLSPAFAQLFHALGAGDELRAVFTLRDSCWGIASLLRSVGDGSFPEPEADAVRALCPVVGRVLHEPTVRGNARSGSQTAMLVVDSDGDIVHVTAEARSLLDDMRAIQHVGVSAGEPLGSSRRWWRGLGRTATSRASPRDYARRVAHGIGSRQHRPSPATGTWRSSSNLPGAPICFPWSWKATV